MAGHSKWSNIKRKKGANDAKKSKIFTKLVKEIGIASEQGGSDPTFNPRLRLAIQNAKGANVPKESILRAINNPAKDQKEYNEVTYEGYGAHGVAIMVVCMTEKITRTVASVRAIFTKHGGRLEKNGAITFLFDHKGCFTVAVADVQNEDELILTLIDAGAEVIESDDEAVALHITCAVEDFGRVQKKLEQLGKVPTYAGLDYIPNTLVELSDEVLPKLMKLIDALEEDDDVQKVYHNISIGTDQEHLLG